MILNSEKLITLYWYLAIIGTVVFFLKIALPLEFNAEVHTDFSSITDTDSSFHIFTIEGISAFLMSGGWMGFAALKYLNYELKATLLIAIVSGVLGMFLFAWLIGLFKKTEYSPKVSLDELVERQGKAYTHFSPKGGGKIQIEFCSRLDTLDAVSLDEEEIKAFEPIKVKKVENGVVYIEKERN